MLTSQKTWRLRGTRAVFSLGFWAHCVWNSVAKLTAREVGKHRVVSKHPLNPLFCGTYDDIAPEHGNPSSRTNHEMSALAWMNSCLSGSWYRQSVDICNFEARDPTLPSRNQPMPAELTHMREHPCRSGTPASALQSTATRRQPARWSALHTGSCQRPSLLCH